MEDMDCDFTLADIRRSDVNKFVTLTSTSEVFAMDYLFHYNWSIKEALENYYEESASDNLGNARKKTVTFKVLSWNLDGLDNRFLDIRTTSVINHILGTDPDFVFLQEIVNRSEETLREKLLSHYDFYVDSQPDFYYCGILVKKNQIVKINGDLEVLKFPTSEMGRNLLMLLIEIDGVKIKLMTSHLESSKKSSMERKAQLKNAFDRMQEAECCSIFAGDMNVRDSELRQMNWPPDDIVDVGLHLAAGDGAMATWEPEKNANVSPEMKRVLGMRFDRMYVRHLRGSLTPSKFELLGNARLAECNLHTSDHWAILGFFSL